MITTTQDDWDSQSPTTRSDHSSEAPPAWAIELQSTIADRLAGFEMTLQDLCQRINPSVVPNPEQIELPDAIQGEAAVALQPMPANVALQPDPAKPERVNWIGALLGPNLCEDSRLSDAIQWIETNVLQGSLHALALVGHLLVFRCAPSDRKPSLLKDVGEAYYRCFPKTRDQSNAFEDAIVVWARQHCEAAGLLNSIELVHPGERFDSARHSPVERGGVEVAEVFGWVVVRDGGKVFSKASVQTR